MAFEAKFTLLNEMERTLSKSLTIDEMSNVLSSLSDLLEHYDLKQIQTTESNEDDLLSVYLNAMTVEGKSEKTVTQYKYELTKLLKAIKTTTRNVTVYHLRSFFASEKERGISDRTLENKRQVYSAYFNWLLREGLISKSPTANLGVIKYPKKQKELYSEADVENLKYECSNLRDRAIVCFLQATGCRIGEMVRLNKLDVDLTNLECKVLGKGNKERIVFLNPVAGMVLQKYLDSRTDDYPALFIGKRSERLTDQAVRRMLNKLGEKANVDHVHPHKFRRTTATSLIRHGMPVQEVAAILGHDKLDTTMQYVVLDKTDIKNSYRKYI